MERHPCICGVPECLIPYGYCHCGCGEKTKVNSSNFTSRGWVKGMPRKYCRGHQPKNGEKLAKPRPPVRYESVEGDPCVWVPLTRDGWMLIDAKNEKRVTAIHWQLHRDGYAVTEIKGRPVYIHQFLCPCPKGLEPDHENGNRLDNRERNLRPVTRSQQMCNRRVQKNNKCGIKGVGKRPDGSFDVRIQKDGVPIWIGKFRDMEVARKARLDAEVRYHGEYRRKN